MNTHSSCPYSSLDWLWTPLWALHSAVLAFLCFFPWSQASDISCLSWETGSICFSYLLAQHYQHTLPSLPCNFPGASAPDQAPVTCGWALSSAQWLSCHSVFLQPALKCSLGWNTRRDIRHSSAVGLQSCEAFKAGYSGTEWHFEMVRVGRLLL